MKRKLSKTPIKQVDFDISESRKAIADHELSKMNEGNLGNALKALGEFIDKDSKKGKDKGGKAKSTKALKPD